MLPHQRLPQKVELAIIYVLMPSTVPGMTAWDPSQQMQLEKGLAANRANLKNASSRNIKKIWNNIAANVDKKSARECHDRFFFVRSRLQEEGKKKEVVSDVDMQKKRKSNTLHDKVKATQSAREREIMLVERRYLESFSVIEGNYVHEPSKDVIFRIQFRPTDRTIPHLRFRNDGIQIQVRVPPNYPACDALAFDTVSLRRNAWLGNKFNTVCQKMLNGTVNRKPGCSQPLIRKILHCFDKNVGMVIGLIHEKEEEKVENDLDNKCESNTMKRKPDVQSTMKMWKASEIDMLQNALRKYPKLALEVHDDKDAAERERWLLISSEIPSRSVEDCKYAFEAIVAHVKEGKPLLITQADIIVDRRKETRDMQNKIENARKAQVETTDQGVPTPIFIEVRPVGTKVMLHKLTLGRIGIAQSSQLRLVSICCRCGEKNEVSTSYKTPGSSRCKACSSAHRVVYQPNTLHNQTEILGYIQTQNCVVFDYLPSDFIISCIECAENSFIPTVEIGSPYEVACNACHKHLKLEFGGVDFFDVVDGTQLSLGNEKKKSKKKSTKGKVTGLRRGQPLPGKGTCVHYRKSFRWFRFPCCKQLYPCDICHENSKDCSSVGVWATRIVCGACSCEQAMTNKTCTKCGFSFGPRRTSFWEGGKGNRNFATLSNQDKRKFRGKNKTRSKKSERVGSKKKSI